MSITQEEKIYGLLAQAEDIQKHAVALQRVAGSTLKKLPEASRDAIWAVAEQCIVGEAKKASDGLLEAVQDIRKHAVALHQVAEGTLKKLPDASRDAIRSVAEQCIGAEAKKASDGLLDASNEAKASSVALRRTGLLLGVCLLAFAVVIGGVGYFAGQILLQSSLSRLDKLDRQIEEMNSELSGLQNRYDTEFSKAKNQLETALSGLKNQVKAEQDMLNMLESRTWKLQLKKYDDGTRAIILPKGVEFGYSGPIQNDGRIGIVIKP
jgi:uncharacterized protein HemX